MPCPRSQIFPEPLEDGIVSGRHFDLPHAPVVGTVIGVQISADGYKVALYSHFPKNILGDFQYPFVSRLLYSGRNI